MESKSKTETYSPTLRFPKRVVILGNDVFAWIASSMLLSRFGPLGIRITVCPGTEPTPNQAFTTTPAFGRFLRNLGVDEHDMLRSCEGTYCLASQFSDWAHEGRDFWQPIGILPNRLMGHDVFDVWLSERKAGRLLRPLHSYSAHWTAALARKCPHGFGESSVFADSGEYGFHGDIGGLRDWLKSLAQENGVEAVEGDIEKVFPNGRGGIAQAKLASGKAVPGDFFLDFRRNAQEPKTHGLRMITERHAAARQVPVFTRYVATESGWVTVTPLSKTTEYRFVFSSEEISDAAAAEVIRTVAASSADDAAESSSSQVADVRVSGDIRWKDNVVTVGALCDRVESFSGAALHLHHAAVELLVSLFPNRSVGRATRSEFNQRVRRLQQQYQEFSDTHMQLASQRDTVFGRQLHDAFADGLRTVGEWRPVYDAAGFVADRDPQSAPAWQYQSLMSAAGRYPARPRLSTASLPPANVQDLLRKLVRHNESLIKDLPLHEEMLDWIHTSPFQQQAG